MDNPDASILDDMVEHGFAKFAIEVQTWTRRLFFDHSDTPPIQAIKKMYEVAVTLRDKDYKLHMLDSGDLRWF